MKTALWTLVIVLAVAPLAMAHDLLPPSWRGEAGTSTLWYDNYWNNYDYFTDYGGGLAPPEIHYENGWNYWDGSQFGMPGYGWKLPWGYNNRKLIFEMDNYDNDRLYKDIRVQVTFYAPNYYSSPYYTDPYSNPWYLRVWAASNVPYDPNDPGYWEGSYDVEYADVYAAPGGYDGWMVAAFDLRLEPNPDSETIGLDFGTGSLWPWWYFNNGDWAYPWFSGSVYIDQVVIDTRCSDVPEPSVFCLLAMGGAMMLLVRRCRKA